MEYKVTFSAPLREDRAVRIDSGSPESAHKTAYLDERNDDEDIIVIESADGKVVYNEDGFIH